MRNIISIICLISLFGGLTNAYGQEIDRTAITKLVTIELAHNNLSVIDQYFHQDFKRISQATPGVKVNSKDEFKEFIIQTRKTFPDARTEIQYIIEQGDKVAFIGSYKGTYQDNGDHPEWNGRKIDLQISGFYIFDGKLIKELHVVWDNLTATDQLVKQSIEND